MSYRVSLQLGEAFVGYFTPTETWAQAFYPFEGGLIEQDLTHAWDDPLHVLGGLTMGWRLSSDELHAPVEPLTARFQLATRDVNLLAALHLGDIAAVRFTTEDSSTSHAAVYGRLSEISAENVRRFDRATDSYRLWTIYTVTVLDHTATSDEPVDITIPNQTGLDDLPALFGGASGIPVRDASMGDWFIEGLTAADRDTDNAGVISLLREYLRFMPVGYEGLTIPVGMLQLAPISTQTGQLQLLSLHLDDWREPLVPVEVPASRVQLSGAWRHRPAQAVNTVTVRMPAWNTFEKVKAVARAADWEPGDVVIRRNIDTGGLLRPSTTLADWIAATYLPDPDDVGWSRESFTYTPENVSDLGGDWFPDWSTEEFSDDVNYLDAGLPSAERVAPCFRTEVTVAGLVPEANLAGTGTTYTGRLASVDLTLSGGRVTVGFSLRRTA